jgi:DNA-directed RNA polymerase specialized sigma24 family protein
MTKRTEIEKLYETHFGDAVRLATMILGDTSSTEDVAQDAFLRSA